MMSEQTKFNAPATYNSAAADYEQVSGTYWSFFGQRTVARLALQPGAPVLDAAFGGGLSWGVFQQSPR